MKPQAERTYFFTTCISAVLLIALLISINVYVDMYGLYRETTDKTIYHNEKLSKYLLAHRYIPENFNRVVIGPSLSDNLDLSTLGDNSKRYYNASVMGANITELNTILKEIVKHGEIDQVIICLHPYLTKDAQSKGQSLNNKTRYSALGSLNLYQTYVFYFIRTLNILPTKYPQNQFSRDGTNNYYNQFRVENVKQRIKEEAIAHHDEPIVVNRDALRELKKLLVYLDAQNIQVLGYFHPVPSIILEANKMEYLKYQQMIESLFLPSQHILDFNHPSYRFFRDNATNYIDHGHLSKRGQQFIVKELQPL
ncbi:hypothetical protein BFP72_04045 [Reichenbachiella sp. 5M10]|uniref:hypothetical protein n=1 Tax=Reichenbachiella sp. 5M10 TaxID=1889772 RepID=UPI000C1596DA|nr:hypothetical protein [Reichenbachiella sp. 5M10]PIB34639.1 hypothetical protein BFP72_04045 [Reichenbachiella sp. 5M10]